MQNGLVEMQMAQLLEDRGASPVKEEETSSVEAEDIDTEIQPVPIVVKSEISSIASAPEPDEEAPAGAAASSSGSAGNKEAQKQGRRRENTLQIVAAAAAAAAKQA